MLRIGGTTMLKSSRLIALFKNKHLKFGLPFFAFIFGGVFYLREFQTIRYEFRNTSPLDRETMRKEGIMISEKPVTLEEVYEEIKDMDIDNWENIRGPRLFEEN